MPACIDGRTDGRTNEWMEVGRVPVYLCVYVFKYAGIIHLYVCVCIYIDVYVYIYIYVCPKLC